MSLSITTSDKLPKVIDKATTAEIRKALQRCIDKNGYQLQYVIGNSGIARMTLYELLNRAEVIDRKTAVRAVDFINGKRGYNRLYEFADGLKEYELEDLYRYIAKKLDIDC